MVLRITQNILLNNAIRDITRNAVRLNLFRQQLSTGRRVNQPSDDPATFLRIIPLTNEIASVRRFQENAVLAKDLLNTASSAFQDASAIMAEARKIAVQGANGTLNDSDRQTLASSTDQLLRQMLGLANSRLGDRYLFSGTRTSVQPFVLTEGTGGTFVTYNGNGDQVKVEVAPGVETAVTSSGETLFMKHQRGPTVFSGKTGAAPGTGTDSGKGQAILVVEHTGFSNLPTGVLAGSGTTTALGDRNYTITVSGSTKTISIDGGPPVPFDATSTNLEIPTGDGGVVYLDMSGYSGGTASGVLRSEARMSWDGGQNWTAVDFSATNQQLVHTDSGDVLNVDSTGIKLAGKDLITFKGTFDPFNVLVALRDLLLNKPGLPPAEQQKRLTALIGELESVSELVLEGLRDLGARSAHLDLTENRMARLELSMQESLSRDQDIDISEVILKMTQRDTAYQASLAVGARVIGTSLLDFLR